MDPEQQTLLAPATERLASVKVFPLIPALRKDVTVRSLLPLISLYSILNKSNMFRIQLVCISVSP